MDRQEFYAKRKETIQARYKELGQQKEPSLNRDERLDIISNEHNGISHGTIKQILSNSTYQKPLPKSAKQI